MSLEGEVDCWGWPASIEPGCREKSELGWSARRSEFLTAEWLVMPQANTEIPIPWCPTQAVPVQQTSRAKPHHEQRSQEGICGERWVSPEGNMVGDATAGNWSERADGRKEGGAGQGDQLDTENCNLTLKIQGISRA